MRAYALLMFVVMSTAVPASADDATVLRDFGILGTLAVDCNAPYGPDNPYTTYAVSPSGSATRTLQMMEGLNATLALRNVHHAGADRLEYDETGRQSELKITILRIDGKFRSWRSVRTSGPESGKVLIDDGIITGNGVPTPAQTFCHAN
jgi:hypothetical protein